MICKVEIHNGNIISLSGNGFDNAYIIGGADSEDGWDISDKNIFHGVLETTVS